MWKLNHFSSYYLAQSDGTYGNYRGRGERRKVTARFVAHQLNAWICCLATFDYKQSQPLTTSGWWGWSSCAGLCSPLRSIRLFGGWLVDGLVVGWLVV